MPSLAWAQRPPDSSMAGFSKFGANKCSPCCDLPCGVEISPEDRDRWKIGGGWNLIAPVYPETRRAWQPATAGDWLRLEDPYVDGADNEYHFRFQSSSGSAWRILFQIDAATGSYYAVEMKWSGSLEWRLYSGTLGGSASQIGSTTYTSSAAATEWYVRLSLGDGFVVISLHTATGEVYVQQQRLLYRELPTPGDARYVGIMASTIKSPAYTADVFRWARRACLAGERNICGGCEGTGTLADGTSPRQWQVVVSGLTGGCATYNGTWVLDWVGPVAFDALAGGDYTCTWVYSVAGVVVTLVLYDLGATTRIKVILEDTGTLVLLAHDPSSSGAIDEVDCVAGSYSAFQFAETSCNPIVPPLQTPAITVTVVP